MKKTKIVATVGPSSDSLEKLESLINAGVDVFRFNFSHSTHEYHKANLDKVREISNKLGTYTAILQDISGPKIRLGEVDGVMELSNDDNLEFMKTCQLIGKDKKVCINHPHILESVKVGDMIYLADGTVRVQVLETLEDRVVTKVLVGGEISSKKGVNFPMTKIPLSSITEKDRRDIEFGVKIGVDLMAISFVRDKNDILEAKRIIKEAGGNIPVFAKIEKNEAINNYDEILEVVDGIMVARGDLGVEVGVEKVPVIQKMIIKKANEKGLPVITATQMLTSMIHSPFPTRAEVSDIANAILDGSDAVMLSDETTVGKYPIEAVSMLVKTALEVETIYPYYKDLATAHIRDHAIAASATQLAQDIEAAAMIVFSESGSSAKHVAKFRPKSKIYVNSDNLSTLRKLQIVFGIIPLYVLKHYENSDEMTYEFLVKAENSNIINANERYVLTVGYPSGKGGSTNMIRTIDGNSLEYIKKNYEK